MSRIMIGTPCALGMVHNQYMLSLMETQNWAVQHKNEIARQVVAQIPGFNQSNPAHAQALQQTLQQHSFDLGVYTMSGESLLPRARNHIAQSMLTGGWDKLIFIDSDTHWTWQQFKTIVESPHPILGGVVPLKTYVDFPRSFRTSLNYLPFLSDEQYFEGSLRDLPGTIRMAQGHGSPIVKVPFTGTAFLCIHRSVFMKLAETSSEYIYPNPSTGQPETHWSIFDGGPLEGIYYSEDWQFCHKAREAGFDVNIHTDVRLGHVGNHHFVAG